MLSIIDLSHPLATGTGSSCAGHPQYSREACCTLERDGSAVSRLTLSSHTGTHIDAPAHFIAGAATVDALDLSMLVGLVHVVDARGRAPDTTLTWDDVFAPHAGSLKSGVAVLVCTGWAQHWGTALYARGPRVSLDAARRLADAGVRVLGIDTLSPDGVPRKDEDCDDVLKSVVHMEWLGRGGVIVENLVNLEDMLEDRSVRWMASFLPLRLEKCDGSPIRAVAWRSEGAA